MNKRILTIAMNGVTGRMGAGPHLARSLSAIFQDGGVPVGDTVIVPQMVLVGRNIDKLNRLREVPGVIDTTTDLNGVLADAKVDIYFDSQTTGARFAAVKSALEAGKHVYCEKPAAASAAEAMELHGLASSRGLIAGVVQDKLWLGGMVKLGRLLKSEALGRVLDVRGEFGYWVFAGGPADLPAQRPSWNYRSADGGGIVRDMLAHWEYVLRNLVAPVKSVLCTTRTLIPRRFDEAGTPYEADADDACYCQFELDGGTIVTFNSSWTTAVYHRDLLSILVNGSKGSAVASLRGCEVQTHGSRPLCRWNPDVAQTVDPGGNWSPVHEGEELRNAFRAQWMEFLAAVHRGASVPWDLRAGARGVLLADTALKSAAERRWIDVPWSTL